MYHLYLALTKQISHPTCTGSHDKPELIYLSYCSNQGHWLPRLEHPNSLNGAIIEVLINNQVNGMGIDSAIYRPYVY